MDLADMIKKKQQELITLAEKKDCILTDPEVYEQSCVIDKMIVELMKSSEPQR